MITWQELLPFGQAIGWTLIHSIWQILLVSLGIRLVLLLIPQKRSKVRYTLMVSSLVLMVAIVGWSFSKEWTAQQKIVVSTVNNPALNSQNFDSANSTNSAEFLSKTASAPPQINKPELLLSSQLASLGTKISPYLPMIAIAWFIGAFLFSIAMIFGFWQLRQLQKHQVQPADPIWQKRFEQLCQQMNIRRPIEFLLSESIPEPITFHFLKPVVLAPVSIFSGLTTDQIELLLLHELAHIRRNDFLVNTLQTIIEVLFFYHPAIWWLSAKIREEREHCCDDLVLKIQNNPQLYAEALTQLHHIFNHPLKTKLIMSAKGNQSHFSKRIFRLFGQYDSRPSVFKGSLIALVLLLTVLGQPFLKPSTLPAQTEATIQEVIVNDDQNALPSEAQSPDHPVLENMPTAENIAEPPSPKSTAQTRGQTSDTPAQDAAPSQIPDAQKSALTGNTCLDLIRAVKKNDVEAVRQLLKSTDPDCVYRANRAIDAQDDWEPRTPLLAAARNGHLEIGRLLLEANADVKFHAEGDETPLMAAAHYGHLDFVKLLIDNGAPVNTKVSGDGTALLVASSGGHEDVVRYLIDQKAEVNAEVSGDGTALICAVREGHYAVAKILLDNGADPFQNVPGDEYAMYHARVSGNKAMINLLKQYEDRR